MKRLGRLGVPGIIGAVVLLAFLCILLFYNSEIGMASDIGIREPVFTSVDFSSVPPAVVADAEKMAEGLVGRGSDNYQNTVNQLVGSYIAAGESDIVIYFNSGGMGWNYVRDTPGWESILNGITAELEALGYRPLIINYCRTNRGLIGSIKEIIEAATRYTKKVVGMEKYAEFLINHLPHLKYIIAGESTGTVITEEAMSYFRDKPNVYSIQTGNPFWYKTVARERTLRISSNGRGTDSFAYGNVPSMIFATVKGWLGLTSPADNPGNILKWLKAPGHAYAWEYSVISAEITGFLESNFPEKN